jgi:hypothetical protein
MSEVHWVQTPPGLACLVSGTAAHPGALPVPGRPAAIIVSQTWGHGYANDGAADGRGRGIAASAGVSSPIVYYRTVVAFGVSPADMAQYGFSVIGWEALRV